VITVAALVADGCAPNVRMWIGDGWFYCRTCRRQTSHVAYSHRGKADCFEVCTVCHQYHGPETLRSTEANMPEGLRFVDGYTLVCAALVVAILATLVVPSIRVLWRRVASRRTSMMSAVTAAATAIRQWAVRLTGPSGRC
jgi:hypothetical protein